MRVIKLIVFASVFILLTFAKGYAQQHTSPVVNRSETVQTVNGKKFYFHAVLKGQTLYSIARAYNVSQEVIIRENPEIEEHGLRFDQLIRIPVVSESDTGNQTKTGGGARKNRTEFQETDPVDHSKLKTDVVEQIVFKRHKVQKRETIYGISQMYDITMDQLIEYNPEVRKGLKTNMVLRIPQRTKAIKRYREYEVKAGQTLYSLTREFGFTREELEEMNPMLKTEGLKAGQVLRLPATQPVNPPFLPGKQREERQKEQNQQPTIEKPVITDPYCLDPQLKRSYNVALMLPLYIERFKASEEDEQLPVNHSSFTFIEYYNGLQIAIDSLRKSGVDIKLTVLDVTENTETARFALRTPQLENMDLIIGPFFEEPLKMIANFARVNDIPVVSPLYWEDIKSLYRFPNLFQATPSIQTQMKDMGRFIIENHAGDNIILVHNNRRAIELIENFSKYMNDQINEWHYRQDSIRFAKMNGYFLNNGVYVGEQMSDVYVFNDSLVRYMNYSRGASNKPVRFRYMEQESLSEFVYNHTSLDSLKTQLDTNRRNILITLMGNEALIANYTRQLNTIRDTFDITVYGVPQWRNYKALDYSYLQNLNVHLFDADFIDYKSDENIDFIRRYRNSFATEPGEVAFGAVKQGMFFFNALADYGSEFFRCIPLINENSLTTTPFWFERPYGDKGGWENKYVYIYKFEDYSLKNVKTGNQGYFYSND